MTKTMKSSHDDRMEKTFVEKESTYDVAFLCEMTFKHSPSDSRLQ